jgi:A/G-specific adenine glycosylase
VARRRSDDERIAERLAPLILPWYRAVRRALPWRDDPTPYSVWVSEVMLQQTRAEVVAPYYRRFLARFPTLADLAAASIDDVLALWSGLGYYRRARGLHAGARAIIERHAGEFPRSFADALDVPGVGPYTAGAVLSIAYGFPVPVVDGNVARVLTRLLRRGGDPRSARNARSLRELAAGAIPPGAASEFNQGLMELGATVCKPRRPECPACPLAVLCLARRHGDPERYPEGGRKERAVEMTFHAAVIGLGDGYLLERQREPSLLAGLWVFPFVVGEAGLDPARALASRLRARPGLGLTGGSRLTGHARHAITYRRITIEAFSFELEDPAAGHRRVDRDPDFRWARLEELGRSVAVSSIATKVARLIAGGAPAREGRRHAVLKSSCAPRRRRPPGPRR